MLEVLDLLENGIWTYIGVPMILILGLYFSIKGRFFQILRIRSIFAVFSSFMGHVEGEGVHPLKTFFASIGGCIGIGNIVAVCTAVQLGGPGALVWLWVAGFLGMLIKYSEIYLGMRYRERHPEGGYRGGPMYFLKNAFGGSVVPTIVCGLLCVYGVEVYMFRVITDSISANMGVDRFLVAGILLPLVLLSAAGGVQRVGTICTAIIPFFLVLFGGMSLWVLFLNAAEIPGALVTIFSSAFNGHAAVGAFAGAGVLTTASEGVRRACYTGDIGVGYASVIHSETSTTNPKKQAALGIVGIYIDTFLICTLSILLVVVTGVWKEPIDASLLVQTVLERHFLGMWLFMPLLIFLLGFSTMIAYLVVGAKAAEFLFPKWGRKGYLFYAAFAFIAISFVDTTHALMIMSLALALLLCFNLVGIFLLRGEVELPNKHSPIE